MSRSRPGKDRPLLVNTILFIVLVVLVNIGVARIPVRLDLTRNREYSLTDLTREVLTQADQPIRVRVFFTPNLPQPYDSASGHLLDLLREYRREAPERFAAELLDVQDPAVIREATEFGVTPLEIQQIQADQYESRTVYMAVVVEYGGLLEVINPVTERYAVEYRLTDSIARLIRRQSTYAGVNEPLTVRYIYTPALEGLGVHGLPELESVVFDTLASLRTATGLQFTNVAESISDPTDVDLYARTYDLPRIRWSSSDGTLEAGLLAAVVEHDGRIQALPIAVRRNEEGTIEMESPSSLRRRLVRAVDIGTGVIPTVGYILGHGEPALDNDQNGAGAFNDLVSARYELVDVWIEEGAVPDGLAALIVTSPADDWSMEAARRLDAYLTGGGRVLAMVDPYVLAPAGTEGTDPEWRPTSTALLNVLSRYGITITDELVLDERSFVAQRDGVQRQLFQAPVVQGRDVNQDHPITSGIDHVTLFSPAAIDLGSGAWSSTVLLRSSDRSWTSREPDRIGPWIEEPPASAAFGARVLAAIVEEHSDAAFGAGSGNPRGGRIIALGTSALTASPMLDGTDRLSNRVLVENMVDVAAGNDAYAELRTKGMTQPRLDETTSAGRTSARVMSVLIPALMFGVAALAMLLARRRRRASIRAQYGDAV
ncbi:MAG: GldG family protein [Spirochaetales bacterium]|nr:GldG family protein [Spirochaetales bacterium]